MATAAKFKTANGSITLKFEDGAGNVDVVIPRAGIQSPVTSANQAEMETGTETAKRLMSPAEIKQAIEANKVDFSRLRATAWALVKMGAGSIYDSENILAVTSNFAGNTTAFFTELMDNANYVSFASSGPASGLSQNYSHGTGGATVSSIVMQRESSVGAGADSGAMSLLVFGGKD